MMDRDTQLITDERDTLETVLQHMAVYLPAEIKIQIFKHIARSLFPSIELEHIGSLRLLRARLISGPLRRELGRYFLDTLVSESRFIIRNQFNAILEINLLEQQVSRLQHISIRLDDLVLSQTWEVAGAVDHDFLTLIKSSFPRLRTLAITSEDNKWMTDRVAWVSLHPNLEQRVVQSVRTKFQEIKVGLPNTTLALKITLRGSSAGIGTSMLVTEPCPDLTDMLTQWRATVQLWRNSMYMDPQIAAEGHRAVDSDEEAQSGEEEIDDDVDTSNIRHVISDYKPRRRKLLYC